MMSRPSLLNLETLCHIARLGTFQAAADHLNTSQSAISARVRELETRLGIQIFQKRGRHMEFTMQGRELVRRIQPLLFAVDDVVLSLEDPAAATGLVRIGISEIIGFTWFPKFIDAARRTMPQLTYEVDVSLTAPSRQNLETGKFDLVFIGGSLDALRVYTHPIGLMEILWVGAPSVVGRKGRRSKLSWMQLLDHQPLWSLARGSVLFPILREAIEHHKLKVKVDICNNVVTMVQLVVAGTGIGLLPKALVEPHLTKGELVILKDAPAVPPLPIQAAWHADQSQTVLRKLVELAASASTFPQN